MARPIKRTKKKATSKPGKVAATVKKVKQHSGGEAKKTAKKMRASADKERDFEGHRADGHDNKRGNIGPSGQGSHRGRERNNRQTTASGRTDVSSAGRRKQRRPKANGARGSALP